jgi:hypothetical protein
MQSNQIAGVFSFGFLLDKKCPSKKSKNGFQFFLKFTIGIKSFILLRDNFYQKEYKRKMVGALIRLHIVW